MPQLLTFLIACLSLPAFAQTAVQDSTQIALKEAVYATHDYDWIDDFSHGVALARQGNDFFAIDDAGEFLFPLTSSFKRLEFNKFGHALLYNDYYHGVRLFSIDKQGEVVDTFERVEARAHFDDSHFICKYKGVEGIYSFSEEKHYPNTEKIYGNFGSRAYITKKEDKYGVLDFKNEIIIPIEMDEIKYYPNDVYRLKKENKYALQPVNEKMTKAFYDYAESFRNRLFVVGENEKYGIVNGKNKRIMPMAFDSIFQNGEYLFAKKKGQWGAINEDLEEQIPFRYGFVKQYSGIYHFRSDQDTLYFDYSEGRLIAKQELPPQLTREERRAKWEKDKAKWAKDRASKKNKFVKPKCKKQLLIDGIEYDFYYERFGLKVIYSGNQVGVIDRRDKIILPFQDSSSISLRHAFIEIERNKLYGAYDLAGNKILDIKYGSLKKVRNGFLLKEKTKAGKKLWGYLSEDKKVQLPAIYSRLRPVNDSTFLAYKEKDQCGLMNIFQADQCQFEYQGLRAVWDRNFIAIKNNKYGRVNAAGEVLTPFTYDEIEPYPKGYFAKLGEEYTYFNYNDQPLNTNKFSSVQMASRYYFIVESNGLFGILDESGKFIIEPTYQGLRNIGEFEKMRFLVTQKDLKGVIDIGGNEIIPMKYKMLNSTEGGYIVKDQFFGILDEKGVPVLELIYDRFHHEYGGYLVVEKDGNVGLFENKKGWITKVNFDSISFKDSKKHGYSWLMEKDDYAFVTNMQGKCLAGCPSPKILVALGVLNLD